MQLSKERYHILKTFVFELDIGRCHICNRNVSYGVSVLDHIIPIAAYGRDNTEAPDEYWNLRLAHPQCNIRRSNAKIPGQLRLPIVKE